MKASEILKVVAAIGYIAHSSFRRWNTELALNREIRKLQETVWLQRIALALMTVTAGVGWYV